MYFKVWSHLSLLVTLAIEIDFDLGPDMFYSLYAIYQECNGTLFQTRLGACLLR